MHRALSDFVLELVQNAVEAGSGSLWITIRERGGRYSAAIRDNGPGMTREQRQRAQDAFRSRGGKHPRRSVGLGLPLLRQTAEMTGGRWRIRSRPGAGTRVAFEMDVRHPDTPPAGDTGALVTAVLGMTAGRAVTVLRERDGRAYRLDGPRLADAVGGLHTAGGLSLVRQFVAAREQELAGDSKKRG